MDNNEILAEIMSERSLAEGKTELKSKEEAQHQPSKQAWAVAANIIFEHPYGDEKEIRYGTKHFKPGAKVHVVRVNWRERAEIIGRQRKSGRYIKTWMPAKYLANPRVEM